MVRKEGVKEELYTLIKNDIGVIEKGTEKYITR